MVAGVAWEQLEHQPEAVVAAGMVAAAGEEEEAVWE
jgi:hypothetical protein